ncbi:membrane protein insertion efficiency factor YidD [Borreliella carolinensis]|uniref:membrane protein insertion efficiency factor YidD n=1 Tax=Borreliella carolinensis TaxID=478174 RepID=UPI002943A4B9|nr:membrane protein insertion efficiency factor YidD [Borreliella carolinensis]WNY64710.1 membrane protein insertion efficiency factor YidD [Borreliella carolinensis]
MNIFKILFILNYTLIFLIKIYQNTLSKIFGLQCIYKPTCSKYSIECLKKYNFLIALTLMTLRIIRCNALFKGGNDFIPKYTPISKSLKEFKKRLIK